jgi:hypothetical protein
MAPKLRPLVVLERVAAQIKHAVNASSAAEDAPLEPPKFAAIQCRDGSVSKFQLRRGDVLAMNAVPGILVVSPSLTPPASIRAMRTSGIVCDRRPVTTQPAAPAPTT